MLCCVASAQFSVDVVLLMAPMMLCFTVLSDAAAVFLLSLIIVVVTILTLTARQTFSHLKQSSADLLVIDMTAKRSFVTNYRAFVNAASAVCILAVDFVVFPRRLCKTETYGTALMDAGVASYVFANALVSPEARAGHVSRYLAISACSLLSIQCFCLFTSYSH